MLNLMLLHAGKSEVCGYSQDWSIVSCDAVRAGTEAPGQRGGRRPTSAAGSLWPAWSSAGPATRIKYTSYNYNKNLNKNTYINEVIRIKRPVKRGCR